MFVENEWLCDSKKERRKKRKRKKDSTKDCFINFIRCKDRVPKIFR